MRIFEDKYHDYEFPKVTVVIPTFIAAHYCEKGVLIDFDLHYVTRRMVMQHFLETLHTIWRHFGSLATLRWLFIQQDVSRLIRLWLHSVRLALMGK